MPKCLTLTLLHLSFTVAAFASLPDSIRIIDKSTDIFNSYRYEYVLKKAGDRYSLYQIFSLVKEQKNSKMSDLPEYISDIPSTTIASIVNALDDSSFRMANSSTFSISGVLLNDSKDSLWSYVQGKYQYWNAIQEQFVLSSLLKIENYDEALTRRFRIRTMNQQPEDSTFEFSLMLYYAGRQVKVSASEELFGLPWRAGSSNSYNPLIAKEIAHIIPENKSLNKSWLAANTQRLIKALAEDIYEDLCREEVKRLAPVAYTKEISELQLYFKIIASEEWPYLGRYVDAEAQKFRITLKNDLMRKGVTLQYFISRSGNTLYPRDSLFKNSDSVIARVQGIKFLMDFLDGDSSRKIDICFFDNAAFNDYTIESFNGNPQSWKQYDEKVKRKPEFKGYNHLYCGCNFRLEKEYLKSAILFELTDEFKNASMWVLLPDGTPVLHFFEGKKAYKYTLKDYKIREETLALRYACRKFDSDGRFKNN